MGVSWFTRLQAVWQSGRPLLLLVPSAKMRLQMTSRSHGGWLWAVWCYCCCSSTTLPLVTVTAHLNEHHGAPPGGFNAAWAQDTCLPFWCTKYILYVHIIYLEVTKSGRLKKIKNFYIQWTILNESFRVALICGLEISLFQNFFAALPLKVLRWARDGFARLNTGNAGSELSVCKVPGEAIVNCHDYSTTEQGCAPLCTKASCSTVPRQASTYCYIWLQRVCVCKLEGQPLPIVRLEHAMTKHAISIQQHL